MVVKKNISDTQTVQDSPEMMESLTAIDQFCDTCWLEDGLSKNTLAAYRKDLDLFARWLDRKSTRLNSSHSQQSRMPSSA